MDSNQLCFSLLADARHFPARSRTIWDGRCRVLKLASERRIAPPADAALALGDATSAMERVPRTLDAIGSLGRWIEEPDDEGNIGWIGVKSSHLPDEVRLLGLPGRPSDLAVGHDGVLYIALEDGVLLHDLRGRWRATMVRQLGFAPWRIATDPTGGCWLLDRANDRLARLHGLPLADRPHADYAPTTFRPHDENPCPPTIRVLDNARLDTGERPIAITAQTTRGLALLTWIGDGEAHLRLLDARSETLGTPVRLDGARYAYALEWLDADRLALRLPGRRDAPAWPAVGHTAVGHTYANADANDGENDLLRAPLGEIYPIAEDGLEAPFVHRLDGPPHYPTAGWAEPLHCLSIANLARQGEAASFDGVRPHLLDSGSQQTVWHRLYAEASIPAGTGFIAWLAATAEPAPPADASAWCAHRFGRGIARPAGPQEPQAAWEAMSSELPGHPGLGPWPRETERAGLYSVLIQNSRRRVRALAGRYLWVRLELFGDGRAGPEIAALRAWQSRFSYRDKYLPRIYRETLYGAPALAPGERLDGLDTSFAPLLDAGGTPAPALTQRLANAPLQLGAAPQIRVEEPGRAWLLVDATSSRQWVLKRESNGIGLYRPQATPADFLERLLGSFEAMLTPLEDRVAAAHLVTDPASTPEDKLDWLGAWIGIAFDGALPAARRRDWLAAAPRLARYHGTRRGLALTLDLATGGGVRGGEIVLLEDFRLRRLFATLLGVDLADEKDPLLPGLAQSGNSVVGDTLILGEAEKTELLALFRSEVATLQENAAVLAFYEQLAHRATVLVHQEVSPQDLGLIRRVVELESPAHVEVRVLTATWPLLVGVASLVGVDTYLGPPRKKRPARLNVSGLGLGDYVLGSVSLDPRASGAAATRPQAAPPVANAGTDFVAPFGASFDLDGSDSSAAPGREIARYTWRRLPT
jgi:phage tail-like protein